MEHIRFVSKEHETFYYNMLKAARNSDVFRKRFSIQWGLVQKLETILPLSLTLRKAL